MRGCGLVGQVETLLVHHDQTILYPEGEGGKEGGRVSKVVRTFGVLNSEMS